MGLVIEELTHPYSLTHKDYNRKRMREREFFEFTKAIFFQKFLTFPHFFALYFSIFSTLFLTFFSQKLAGGIYRGMRKMRG